MDVAIHVVMRIVVCVHFDLIKITLLVQINGSLVEGHFGERWLGLVVGWLCGGVVGDGRGICQCVCGECHSLSPPISHFHGKSRFNSVGHEAWPSLGIFPLAHGR